MSRLSPWIVRRLGPARLPVRHGSPAMAVATVLPAGAIAAAGAQAWLDDLRLFATGWIGGLIFFGTLIG